MSNKDILEKLDKTTTKTMVEMIKIKEHVKSINGTLERHENNINELYSKSNKNTLAVGKITAIATLIASVIGTFVIWVGNIIFGGK